MLPPVWQTITLFNPVVYLISGFRWSFYEIADVSVGVSLAMTLLFLVLCLAPCGGFSRPATGSRISVCSGRACPGRARSSRESWDPGATR